MAAFVIGSPSEASRATRPGMRLHVFPGSATPSVFAAGKPFWIGYGFVPDTDGAPRVPGDTTFELVVDGESVRVETELTTERGRVTKFMVADFPDGLPAGWHRFSGRWCDAGVVALTSEHAIEFVER